ncbi:MAG TPA: hypothetical protein VHY83_05215 [Solirubrobacteraceae bacterium]|nr:hypothetical protein [Solirubrobacteraceae bacterium]
MNGIVCLAAVCALGLVAAGAAWGLPEVGRCVVQPGTGRYKDSNCTEKARAGQGQFEFKRNAVKRLFSASGGESDWETASGTHLDCKAVSETGEFLETGATPSTKGVRHVMLSFTGCEVLAMESPCESPGAAPGEIKMRPLTGPLGYVSGAKTPSPVVGVVLAPEQRKGLFAEFSCLGGAVRNTIRGTQGEVEGRKGGNCVIGSVAPANVMSAGFTESYAGKGGQQEPQHLEPATAKFCNLETNANGGAYEQFRWSGTLTLAGEEALEIKA